MFYLIFSEFGFDLMFISSGINAPTSQSFLNYLILAVVYGSMVIHRRKALQVVMDFSMFSFAPSICCFSPQHS